MIGIKLMYLICVIMILITAGAFYFFSQNPADAVNIEFLNSYGWEVAPKAIEKEEVTIPKPLGLVYEGYNDIQKRAGLNIEPYAGEKAVRYTYVVENFPYYIEETVRANVLTVGGVPVAGDIMTVSADGFMESLNFLRENNIID